MCCYTWTLKTLHRLCPSAPKQGWVFCAEAHLKVLPWAGPLSLTLFPPLPKPTEPPSPAMRPLFEACHLPQLRSWRAGRPRQGWASVSSPCTSCCVFFIFALQKAPRPYETWPKHVGYLLEEPIYQRMPTARRVGPNRPSAVWRRGEDTCNTFL